MGLPALRLVGSVTISTLLARNDCHGENATATLTAIEPRNRENCTAEKTIELILLSSLSKSGKEEIQKERGGSLARKEERRKIQFFLHSTFHFFFPDPSL